MLPDSGIEASAKPGVTMDEKRENISLLQPIEPPEGLT